MDQNISGGSIPPPLQISTIVNWLISLTALAVAIYSLYLQRRDKRPRLKVEHQLGMRQIELIDDGHSGHTLGDDFCLVITLRNPTEKDITLSDVYFVQRGKAPFRLEPWQPLPTVASHKAAEAIIPRKNLLRAFDLRTKAKGHIRVKDLLGNISSSENKHYDLENAESYFPSHSAYAAHLARETKRKEAWEREDF